MKLQQSTKPTQISVKSHNTEVEEYRQYNFEVIILETGSITAEAHLPPINTMQSMQEASQGQVDQIVQLDWPCK